MGWYKIFLDGEIVTNIEKIEDIFKGQDASGLGISVFDDDGKETYIDAHEVASYNKEFVIASFDDDKMGRVIEALISDNTVEIMYA